MNTQTQPNQSESASDPNGDGTSIEWLRNEMQIRLMYIEDSEMKGRVLDWIEASFDIRAASVEGHIEARLGEVESKNKMYNHDGVDEGTEAFPDDCEGCPHYGGGCPIVTQKAPKQKIEQLAEEADSPTEFKRGLRRIAGRYECHRISELMSEWDNEYKSLAVEGIRLYREIATDIEIGETDSDGLEPKVDLQADAEEGSY